MLKANGCKVNLDYNKPFTLASDISAVVNATKLDFSALNLEGPSCISLVLNQCSTTALTCESCAQASSRSSSSA